MKIVLVRVVPHREQRYPTCGDWQEVAVLPDGSSDWMITVSDLGDWRMNFLVSLHEQIEMALCKSHGVSEEAVTAFDLAFIGHDEPGDDPAAPYQKEHQFATNVERLLAHELGVDWNEYEHRIEDLDAMRVIH